MTKTIRTNVRGTVQGVGFRYATSRKASQLGISGWVKNELDGSVSTALQGSDEALGLMVQWLRIGPEFAEVTHVDTRDSDSEKKFGGFEILY
jgi:acylphosphatase